MNSTRIIVARSNKAKLLRCIDELAPIRGYTGISNSAVKIPKGQSTEYNTDGIGFYSSLTIDGGIQVDQNTFFCFGGGSVGRTMCSILARMGTKRIFITDVNESRAQKLVQDINEMFAPIAMHASHEDFTNLPACTVILNASGLGMGTSIGQSPLPKKFMHPSQFFFDPCVRHVKSQFLLDAEAVGGRILNGRGAVLYQEIVQDLLRTNHGTRQVRCKRKRAE